MSLVISLVSAFAMIYSISAACAILTKKKIEVCVPISILSMVLIIYPFGFFKRLDIGVYVVWAISIVSLILVLFNIIKSIKEKTLKKTVQRLVTPGIFAYAIFWVIFILINHNRVFFHGDEFSHWGLAVKNMFEFNSYGSNPETIMMFRGYPPFSSIFEFFFLKIQNVYREDLMLIAMNILNISFIIPVFQNIKWKESIFKLLIYIPFIFLLPLGVFHTFYTITLIDATLGITMAYALYTYFSDKSNSKYIGIGLALIALPIMKLAGTGLAVFTIISILLDLIIFKLKDISIKKKIVKVVAIFILLVVCLLVGKNSWSTHLKATNTEEAGKTSNITFENIKKLVNHNGEEYQYEIIKNFKEQFFEKKMDVNYVNISNFSIVLIYVIYSVLTFYIIRRNNPDGNDSKKFILYSALHVLFYTIYMISLLILYLYRFSEYEALRLASYPRYSAIYLIGMFMFNTIVIIDSIKEIKKNKIFLLIIIAIILLIYPIDTMKELLRIDNNIQESFIRNYREPCSKICDYKDMIGKDDKVYYISCGSKGMDFHISRYEFIPKRLSVYNSGFTWSLGPARYEGDIWSYNITKDNFEKLIISENYKYLYVYAADDVFKTIFGDLFEDSSNIKDKTMYEVKVDEETVKFNEIKVGNNEE